MELKMASEYFSKALDLDEPLWTTQDGRNLAPSQMETSHICNCIFLLMRRQKKIMLLHGESLFAQSLDAMSYAAGAPDGAAMAAEQASDELMDKGHALKGKANDPSIQLNAMLLQPIGKALFQEALNRGLTQQFFLLKINRPPLPAK